MKLPEDVRRFFAEQGRIGGRKRSQRLSAEERSESARKASRARWGRAKRSAKPR